MAAQVVELKEPLRPVVLVLADRAEAHADRPAARGPVVVPLPFPTPLIHPRAVEALLLAFRPLEAR